MTQESVDRRSFLTLGSAAVLAGCTDTPAPSSPTTSGTLTSAPDWAGFARGLDGTLYRPGESGYDAAHRLFDPRFDSIRPAGVVRVASIADIRESLAFARRYGLVCVSKSGGHSYVGASTVSNGLMIDLSALRSVSYANGVVTVGAGAKLYDIHVALDRFGRSLPTGTCPTVGVAGLTLGGGLGVHTRAYGLTCDRVLSLQVVTADGVFRPCGPTQNADLFWALRGGGGGNFGIVTSFRFSTISGSRLGLFVLTWPESRAAAAIRGWQQFALSAPTTAWANLHLDTSSNGSIAVRAVGVSTTGSATSAAALLEQYVGARASSRTFMVKTHMDAVRWLGGGSTSPRTVFTAGSDVLRGPMDSTTVDALVSVVKSRARSGRPGSVILDPLGGQAAKGQTAWPWRSCVGTIQWYAGLSAPYSTNYQSARNWIASGHRAVAKASAGGYVNYLEPGRALASYFGSSWTRLREVKREYDPGSLFRGPYAIPS